MNIAFITTVDHNVGDDFVREGLKFLLKKNFKTNNISFNNIHKHSPITSRNKFEWFRYLSLSKIVDAAIPISMNKDKILSSDLVVQSGAPVYWCHTIGGGHCCNNEWYVPLVKKRLLRSKFKNIINLAAGSCQKYHSNGNEFCSECNNYIKEFYEICKITTVRDKLSQILLNNIGLNSIIIPCSSIFAIDNYNMKKKKGEYVVINYMKGGAHYVFGQNINFEKWETEFKKFYFELKKKELVVISCHSQKEVNESKKIDPHAKIFYKKNDFLAYMDFYAKAKFGIMNRVHGAFLMASYGKPSIVIGNDSRAKMASEIGLENYFVNDVDHELLNQKYEFLKKGADNFEEKFQGIKEKAFDDYMRVLSIL